MHSRRYPRYPSPQKEVSSRVCTPGDQPRYVNLYLLKVKKVQVTFPDKIVKWFHKRADEAQR